MRKPLPKEDLDLVVERTANVWSAFDRARLFITGGTGFIGSWLLEVVQHANSVMGSRIKIVALSRDPDTAAARAPHLFKTTDVTLIKGDVADFQASVGTIDVCIHAATDVANLEKASDTLRVFDTGVLGTRRVLEFAKANGASRFLLASSGAVYGAQPATLERTPETFLGAPDTLDVSTAYGQSKRAAEWLASAYALHDDLHVTIARIFALVGPAIPLDGPFAAGNFIRDALAGRQIAIKGDGRPVRSYLYMADACVWLLHILLAGERGNAYNVGSESEISIVRLARIIESLCGSVRRAVPDIAPKAGPAPRYVPDTAKARKAFNVEEFTPLEVALAKTINWNRMALTA
ncbi:NAD-dependent epimerase/dehydratase family protein [Paraburkholderia phenoliruptrix]|uniref:dTDP-glucose 4,6-dehydratase n=2 Tax=Paraburkholderia phenoliruptrix TaxID=252970 RepID=K0DJ94_9BURK|nr:NAD-dependent epimerase/dehydratase family protein [Paraburkholderia phenoliruptrix]AFT84797.1 dTDP-glucose 4,6-dehydratase [Paraburkholderia phenoliruptrix BR3459a]CAB4050511.1 dTDP-glucose 4,6-dehydratase [Paraburkholderia phenoliruptrix]